jgi:hypothetical protein
MNYNIVLTEAQNKALEYVSDPTEWINHAINNRCRQAINEICKIYTEHKLNNNEPITAVGKDAMVFAAFEEGLVKTAIQRNEDAGEAELAE